MAYAYCLHFLFSHPLMQPLHFQFSTAAAVVKVTNDFTAKSLLSKITLPSSSFDLIVDYCLPFERLSSTDLWDTSLLVLLFPPWLLLELLCHPLNVGDSVLRSPLISVRTHSLVISFSLVASNTISLLTIPKFNSGAQTSPPNSRVINPTAACHLHLDV